MAEKFRNKYRTTSHRKPNWDYSADALYFLTIVTQNRVCNLGDIISIDGQMRMELSDFGKIVEQEWLQSFTIRNELKLHHYLIMPNHLHAIVEMYNQNRVVGMGGNIGTHGETAPVSVDWVETHGGISVETHGRVSLPKSIETMSIKRNPPIRLPKSISSFMAGFKSAVNTRIDDYIDEHQLDIPKYNRNNHFFQPNYHDHIIRNHQEYQNIANYIINNPANWDNDKLGIKK